MDAEYKESTGKGEMSKVIESYYLCERYTVDWEKVDDWFDKRIEEILKEASE